ncbi:MAG: hypothetical protein AAF376_08360 [Pseudomonadota bacterium]
MITRIIQIALMAGAAALVWWGWQELNILRRTFWWEYRYIMILLGAFLVFSLAQAIAGLITRLTGTDES